MAIDITLYLNNPQERRGIIERRSGAAGETPNARIVKGHMHRTMHIVSAHANYLTAGDYLAPTWMHIV